MFSSLIELREGAMAGRSRRIADLARRLAQHLRLSPGDLHDITLAALLHGIGKFGLSDTVLCKSPSALTFEERSLVMKHPVKASNRVDASGATPRRSGTDTKLSRAL